MTYIKIKGEGHLHQMVERLGFGEVQTLCGKTFLPRQVGRSTSKRPEGFEYCEKCRRLEDGK